MKRAGAGATIAEFTILSSSKSVDNDGQLDTDVTNHNPVEILLKVASFLLEVENSTMQLILSITNQASGVPFLHQKLEK